MTWKFEIICPTVSTQLREYSNTVEFFSALGLLRELWMDTLTLPEDMDLFDESGNLARDTARAGWEDLFQHAKQAFHAQGFDCKLLPYQPEILAFQCWSTSGATGEVEEFTFGILPHWSGGFRMISFGEMPRKKQVWLEQVVFQNKLKLSEKQRQMLVDVGFRHFA